MIKLFYNFAASCRGGNFLGFPPWYKYLPGADNTIYDYGSKPPLVIGHACTPQIHAIGDVWLIGMAILEMLLRVAALAAIVLVVWGGIQFISSQGEPDKTAKARSTVINALIGLVISVSAAAIVSFVAGRFTK